MQNLLPFLLCLSLCHGFSLVTSPFNPILTNLSVRVPSATQLQNHNTASVDNGSSRRDVMAASLLSGLSILLPLRANADGIETPKFVQEYNDFIETPSGWRYRDVSTGVGSVTVSKGDRVVFDWSGYTIGYFGRPFQAKGGPVGGAFDKDLDFSRTIIGSGTMIKAVEEALMTMKPGGVRQVVVPFQNDLSYPPSDLLHEVVGPKPATFSGQRALNFVLENPRLDRTLLFNLKLIRVDKSDGKGSFLRGDKFANL